MQKIDNYLSSNMCVLLYKKMSDDNENISIIDQIMTMNGKYTTKQLITLTYHCSCLKSIVDIDASIDRYDDEIKDFLDIVIDYECYELLKFVNLFCCLTNDKIVLERALDDVNFLKNISTYIKLDINYDIFDDYEYIDFNVIKLLHENHELPTDIIMKMDDRKLLMTIENKNDISYLINEMKIKPLKKPVIIFCDIVCNYGIVISSDYNDTFSCNHNDYDEYCDYRKHKLVLHNLIRYFDVNCINEIQLINCKKFIESMDIEDKLYFCGFTICSPKNIVYNELINNIKSHDMNIIIDFSIKHNLPRLIFIDKLTNDNVNYVVKKILDGSYYQLSYKTICKLLDGHDIIIDYDFTTSLSTLKFIVSKLDALIIGKCLIYIDDSIDDISSFLQKYNIYDMINIDVILSKINIKDLLHKSTDYIKFFIKKLMEINDIKPIFSNIWLHEFFNAAFDKFDKNNTESSNGAYKLIRYLHDKNILSIKLNNTMTISYKTLLFLFNNNYISSDDINNYQLNFNHLEYFGSSESLMWLNKINCIPNDYITMIKLAKHSYSSRYIIDNVNLVNMSSDEIYKLVYELSISDPLMTSDYLLSQNLVNKEMLLENNLIIINKLIKHIDFIKVLLKYDFTKEELFNNINYIDIQDTDFYKKIFEHYKITKEDLINNDDELYKIICTNMMFYNLHIILQDIGFTSNDFKRGNNCFLKNATIKNNIRSIKYLHKDLHFTQEDFMIENSVLISLAQQHDANNVINYYRRNLRIHNNNTRNINHNDDNDYEPKNPIKKNHIDNMLVINCDNYYCSLCQENIDNNQKYTWKCCNADICIDCGNRSIGKQEAKCPFCRSALEKIND